MSEQVKDISKGIDEIRQVYFIGIGGIGMSAIAKFFLSKGVSVSGYDKTPTPLTHEMEAAGMAVHYEERVDLIPKDADLVVYTPAVPKDHRELVYYREQGYAVVKRSDVLQLITESSFNICIAGTHGKTTMSTMTAHLLRQGGIGGTAFLGGISVNYGTNFWSVPGEKNTCVVEADEYDRSFLKLDPDIAVISAMDPDHLDIYGTPEAMEEAFIEFSGKIKPGGLLVYKLGLKRAMNLQGNRRWSYHLQNTQADVYASDIRISNGGYVFDVVMSGKRLENVTLNMGGLHNIENALAAITVASSLGMNDDLIKVGVESFRGVKRRFEYIIKNDRLVFIDDYAHHPEELRALISGAKALFPERSCTVIFQPHLFTRTRDLADGFAEVLDMADEVFLLPIYPARELPIEGVSSSLITGKMEEKKGVVVEKDELLAILDDKMLYGDTPELIITAGAGDIDMLVNPIKKELES